MYTPTNNAPKLSRIQVVSFIVILVGLIASIALVQRQQQLRSKAQSTIVNAFEVEGQGVERVSEDTWTTKSLDITIRVTDLQRLLQQ